MFFQKTAIFLKFLAAFCKKAAVFFLHAGTSFQWFEYQSV